MHTPVLHRHYALGKAGDAGVMLENEGEEREFLATQSPLDYFDVDNFKRALFPKTLGPGPGYAKQLTLPIKWHKNGSELVLIARFSPN